MTDEELIASYERVRGTLVTLRYERPSMLGIAGIHRDQRP